jgi:hypothetical protein
MKKTDAHAFVFQALQDYLNTMPKAIQIAFAEKATAALEALKPVPEPEPSDHA